MYISLYVSTISFIAYVELHYMNILVFVHFAIAIFRNSTLQISLIT